VDVRAGDPELTRLGARRLDFLALAEVGRDGGDFGAIDVVQAVEDVGGVEGGG
jgi:hypothetical protein